MHSSRQRTNKAPSRLLQDPTDQQGPQQTTPRPITNPSGSSKHAPGANLIFVAATGVDPGHAPAASHPPTEVLGWVGCCWRVAGIALGRGNKIEISSWCVPAGPWWDCGRSWCGLLGSVLVRWCLGGCVAVRPLGSPPSGAPRGFSGSPPRALGAYPGGIPLGYPGGNDY